MAQSAGETAWRGLPAADVVPPVCVVGVPTSVDTVHLGPGGSRSRDEGCLFLLGGVGHECVHVVVEDDRSSCCIVTVNAS